MVGKGRGSEFEEWMLVCGDFGAKDSRKSLA